MWRVFYRHLGHKLRHWSLAIIEYLCLLVGNQWFNLSGTRGQRFRSLILLILSHIQPIVRFCCVVSLPRRAAATVESSRIKWWWWIPGIPVASVFVLYHVSGDAWSSDDLLFVSVLELKSSNIYLGRSQSPRLVNGFGCCRSLFDTWCWTFKLRLIEWTQELN